MNATLEPAAALSDYWSVPQDMLLGRLHSTPEGVSAEEAARRAAGDATPFLGFGPLPAVYLVALAQIVLLYVAVAEASKAAFYRSEARRSGSGA